jgi:hypothetical protein
MAVTERLREKTGDKKMTIKQAITDHPLELRDSRREVVANAFKRTSATDIKGFSKDTLESKEFIDNVEASRIEAAGRDISSSQVASIKSHEPYMIAQYRAAKAAGKKSEQRAWKAKINAARML